MDLDLDSLDPALGGTGTTYPVASTSAARSDDEDEDADDGGQSELSWDNNNDHDEEDGVSLTGQPTFATGLGSKRKRTQGNGALTRDKVEGQSARSAIITDSSTSDQRWKGKGKLLNRSGEDDGRQNPLPLDGWNDFDQDLDGTDYYQEAQDGEEFE